MRWLGSLLVLASCYDIPKPTCGFRCGPSAACPSDYACADDGYCHVKGSSPSVTCPLVDAGIDAFDFWPFVQEVSPLEDATGVDIGTLVTVKFTEQVLGISATTFTLVVEGETTPVPAVVTYDFSTRTATLDPDAPLLSSKRYVAMLGDGIEDSRGNPIFGKRTWAFKTAHDMSSPVVTMIDPPNGSTGVPIDSVIVMTFSEQVQYPNGGFSIDPGGFMFGFSSVTALKYTPTGAMQPNTTYTVTITDAVTDLTGNPLANAPVVSSFTTGPDTIVPSVTSVSPLEDETAAPLPIVVFAFLSEPVTGVSSSSFTLHDGATAIPATVQHIISANNVHSARLTPDAPLAANTIYTARLTAGIADLAGNPIVPKTWSFTTEP